ncbi:MAG: Arginyl aminopeptidase, partial [Planctomycetota bacterium]
AVRLLSLAVLAVLAGRAVAQSGAITEQRVRETVQWLAADERQGRDTPSKGLDEAAEWLAARFAAAGLQQVVEESWFHGYTVPATKMDPLAVTASLNWRDGSDNRKLELVPGEQVRLWRAGETVTADGDACTVAKADDPALQRMLNARSARQTVFLEVPKDHPYWTLADGERVTLGARRAAAKPVFLVKEGVLPKLPAKAPQFTADWTAKAAETIDQPLRNVVALLPGTDLKDEYVVVSAHYDHVGIQQPIGGDAVYNGADDDATGTTAVVLIAEALAKSATPLRRSVLFVCFSAEEKGLLGSKAFADNPPVPRDRIVCNINLEMLGRPMPGNEGKAWITGVGYSNFADAVRPAMARAGVGLVDFQMSNMLFGASDNFSFVRHGIVAHSISAGSLHDDYHKPSDEVGKLDIPHMTKVIAGLREAVVDLAGRDGRLEWNEDGKKAIESRRR